MTFPTLPMSIPRYPECGACGDECDHDGDSFVCDPCGLDYGNEDAGTLAVYMDPDAVPCGAACDNGWHKTYRYYRFVCTPCQLPTGHKAAHWTACRPSQKETS